MNRGVPPTARKARTGEFTPPGMTVLARAKAASLRVAPEACRRVFTQRPSTGSGHMTLCPLERPVAQDQVGPGAADRDQRLVDRRLAVDPARGGGRLDHRVLAGDVVRGDGDVHLLAHGADD